MDRLITETGDEGLQTDGRGVEHADCATWIGNPLKLRHGPRVPQRGLEFHQFTEPACAFVDRARGHYVDGTHILTEAPRSRLNSLPLGTGPVAKRLSSLAYGGA